MDEQEAENAKVVGLMKKWIDEKTKDEETKRPRDAAAASVKQPGVKGARRVFFGAIACGPVPGLI